MSILTKARVVQAAAYPESELSWARFPADLGAPEPPSTGSGAPDPQLRHGGAIAVISDSQLAALQRGGLLAIDVRGEYVLFLTIGG
ncbi:hypothetical protein [Frigoribacterium sp. UYMn621]|uniref:hypothetical protein n=1 Tax=Frigoribacterium sp. UYMn621 TaxID=3156343 RepID=UPI00339B81DA